MDRFIPLFFILEFLALFFGSAGNGDCWRQDTGLEGALGWSNVGIPMFLKVSQELNFTRVLKIALHKEKVYIRFIRSSSVSESLPHERPSLKLATLEYVVRICSELLVYQWLKLNFTFLSHTCMAEKYSEIYERAIMCCYHSQTMEIKLLAE